MNIKRAILFGVAFMASQGVQAGLWDYLKSNVSIYTTKQGEPEIVYGKDKFSCGVCYEGEDGATKCVPDVEQEAIVAYKNFGSWSLRPFIGAIAAKVPWFGPYGNLKNRLEMDIKSIYGDLWREQQLSYRFIGKNTIEMISHSTSGRWDEKTDLRNLLDQVKKVHPDVKTVVSEGCTAEYRAFLAKEMGFTCKSTQCSRDL